MLVITRKRKEGIVIGKDIRVIIHEIKGSNVRVGIEAPQDVTIFRDEIYEKIKEVAKKRKGS